MKKLKIINQEILRQQTMYELENGVIVIQDWSGDITEGYQVELKETAEGYEETGYMIEL